MSERSAKDILQSENRMLGLLSALTREFAKGYTGFEFDNLECWAKELDGYRAINEKYLAMDEVKRREALEKEAQMLERSRDAVESGSPAAKYWKNYLDENIWYTRELAKRP